MWLSSGSCCHNHCQVLEKWQCELVFIASLYVCSHPKKGFWIQPFELWFTCHLGRQEDLPHWALETVPVNWSNIWAQHQAEAQMQQRVFRDVRTRIIPRSDQGSLHALRCCRGQSLAGINSVFPRGAGTQTCSEWSRVQPCLLPSHIPDKPGRSSCQDWSFIFLPHQRLLTCSGAAESRGSFLLFRSECAFWSVGIRLQDQMLVSVQHSSKRHAREFCLCRQICPWVPLGSTAQHALETTSHGYSCWSELHLPELIYSNKKHIHPFPTIYCL